MQTFHKVENDENSFLRSIGDGFFVVRLFGAPYNDNGKWAAGGYLNIVVLRQIDLDLLWYKISTSENKLKTSANWEENGKDIPDASLEIFSKSTITPMFIKTKRTQWIFDLYQLEHDIAALVSEYVELSDLTGAIGVDAANEIFRIKEYPKLRELVNFK